ncbi:MAG: hypothetical protein N3B68_09655 [Anaerolineae bacterium]|nr:hypothetical protein [Anaerolineae bacterium]
MMEKWLSDPSVFLVDTTGVEVRRLIAERHAAAISKRSVEIVLHSPFWNLDW